MESSCLARNVSTPQASAQLSSFKFTFHWMWSEGAPRRAPPVFLLLLPNTMTQTSERAHPDTDALELARPGWPMRAGKEGQYSNPELSQAARQLVWRRYSIFFNPPRGNSSHLRVRRVLLIEIWLWSLMLRDAFLHCTDASSVETMAGGSKNKIGRKHKTHLGNSVGNGKKILQVQLRLSFKFSCASWGLEIDF